MLKLLFSEFTRPFPRLTGLCMHNNHMIDQHVVVLTWEEVGFAEPILALITEPGGGPPVGEITENAQEDCRSNRLPTE